MAELAVDRYYSHITGGTTETMKAFPRLYISQKAKILDFQGIFFLVV